MSHQPHLQCDYAALGEGTENTAATDDVHATSRGAAGQTTDEPPRHGAQVSGTCVETGTNTASEPAKQPSRATPAWGRGHLDYGCPEGDARRPNAHTEQVSSQDMDLWINRITTGERLALGVSIRWLLTLLSTNSGQPQGLERMVISPPYIPWRSAAGQPPSQVGWKE